MKKSIDLNKEKNSKKTYKWKIALSIIIIVIVFIVVAAIVGYQSSQARRGNTYIYTPNVRQIEDVYNQGVGTVEVRTLSLDKETVVDRITYTPSGRVLMSVKEEDEYSICTMNDDGTDVVQLYSGKIPGKYRLMPTQDNTKVLLGDAMLECPEGETLDTCTPNAARLITIEFPDDFVNDKNVVDKWTEVIISPDGEYIAWTIRRSDCGAANAMGHLVRYDDSYRIEEAKYISAMNTYVEDPDNSQQLIYSPVIGGEVKQFVHGGTAISLIGSDACGMADSIIQDIVTGETEQITKNSAYDETTLLSPDEKKGIVMTSRFSETSNLSVLGLVPRPYGDALHNIMGQIYMYSITGVRNSRPGNIGPALINVTRSIDEEDYMGVDLSDPEHNWVYYSPMSWKNDSKSLMWVERQREGNGIRVQIATLLDYKPDPAVKIVMTPQPGDYGDIVIEEQIASGKVPGKVSGYMEIVKEKGFFGKSTVSVSYVNYSDDGIHYFNGVEYSTGSVFSKTKYTSNLSVTNASGQEIGNMDVSLNFSAAYRLSSVLKGANLELDIDSSTGTAVWKGKSEDISNLVR